MTIMAIWNGRTSRISSHADFLAVVDKVQSEGKPTMVFLEHDNGSVLVVGIGLHETVLTYTEPGGVPSFHSVGDVERSDVLQFMCRGLPDEFMGEMAVPYALGLQAAKDFVQSGTKPTVIEWEADW